MKLLCLFLCFIIFLLFLILERAFLENFENENVKCCIDAEGKINNNEICNCKIENKESCDKCFGIQYDAKKKEIDIKKPNDPCLLHNILHWHICLAAVAKYQI